MMLFCPRWGKRGQKGDGRRVTPTPLRLEVLEERTVPSIIQNGSFETPDIPLDRAVYGPQDSAWTFNARAGIVETTVVDSTPVFEPPGLAPDGTQVAFLQYEDTSDGSIVGQFSQSIQLPASGRYDLSYVVGGRQKNGNYYPGDIANGDLSYQVLLTNSQTQEETVIALDSTTSFQPYTQKKYTFTADAGTYVLTFRAVKVPGDHTAFFDVVDMQPEAQPDIVPTSLTWDAAQGGVDFAYKVTGAPLPRDTTAALYWATGPTFDQVIRPAVYDTTIERPVGEYGPFYVPNSVLGEPPPGATHLLLVTDPDKLVDESDEGNNVLALAIQKPDLAATSLAWNIGQSGVDFSYAVSGVPLTQDTTAALYWSRGTTLDTAIGAPVYTTRVEQEVGTYGPFYVPSSVLGIPPAEATRLMLVVDPSNLVPEFEGTRDNNTLSVPFYVLKDANVRVPPNIVDRVDRIAAEYYRITQQVFVITDGARTAADMAAILLPRLRTEQGRANERWVYRRHLLLLEEIIAAYDSHTTDAERLAAMTETIQRQIDAGRYISPHLKNNAIDIRSRGLGAVDIRALRRAVKVDPGADLVNETWRKIGPHWHLQFS